MIDSDSLTQRHIVGFQSDGKIVLEHPTVCQALEYIWSLPESYFVSAEFFAMLTEEEYQKLCSVYGAPDGYYRKDKFLKMLAFGMGIDD